MASKDLLARQERVRKLIDRLGGVAAVRKKLGVSQRSAVYNWIYDGKVPPGRVLQMLREYGDRLTLDDIPHDRL